MGSLADLKQQNKNAAVLGTLRRLSRITGSISEVNNGTKTQKYQSKRGAASP